MWKQRDGVISGHSYVLCKFDVNMMVWLWVKRCVACLVLYEQCMQFGCHVHVESNLMACVAGTRKGSTPLMLPGHQIKAPRENEGKDLRKLETLTLKNLRYFTYLLVWNMQSVIRISFGVTVRKQIRFKSKRSSKLTGARVQMHCKMCMNLPDRPVSKHLELRLGTQIFSSRCPVAL